MNNKKIRIRVKFDYYYNGKSWYKVQYKYNFKIFWINVLYFDNYGDTGEFSTLLFNNYDSATEFARKIKNIDDIKKYNKKEYNKYKEWKEHKKKLWNKNKPTKKITNIL